MSQEQTAPVHYRLDASRSRFTAQVFADGLFSFFAHNPTIAIRGFGGDARLVAGTFHAASLLVLARADSLAVASKVSDNDRREIERVMREEVLEADRYPEIVYVSSGIAARREAEDRYRVEIEGKLSLHGVTRNQQIGAAVTLNGPTLRAQGEFSVRQSDYNIKLVSVAAGTLKVKDEVKLSFDIFGEQAAK